MCLERVDKEFNPDRFKVARLRRKMTYRKLAERTGLSSKTISKYEKDGINNPPSIESLKKISQVLSYPAQFFFEDDIDEISTETVSFRALSKMTAAQRDAAISAGRLSLIVNSYIQDNFELPKQDFIDLRGYDPEVAAETIREHWALGSKKIGNLIHLLESKGVRVFSLSENTLDVDAFSFWKDGLPFIFLNNRKSAERSRFDAAHELGHLLLHKHASPFDDPIDVSLSPSRVAEQEADNFASAFLMPKASVANAIPNYITIEDIIELKSRWSVSAVSLIFRLHKVNLITEWQYRKLMEEASIRGYRKEEPQPIPREKSLIFEKIMPVLAKEGLGVKSFAKELKLPLDEVTNLMFMPSLIAR